MKDDTVYVTPSGDLVQDGHKIIGLAITRRHSEAWWKFYTNVSGVTNAISYVIQPDL